MARKGKRSRRKSSSRNPAKLPEKAKRARRLPMVKRATANSKKTRTKITPRKSRAKTAGKKAASKSRKKPGLFVVRRRQRSILVFSEGKAIHIAVSRKSASAGGAHLNAVRRFLETNDPTLLKPFSGRSIKDRSGEEHVFETRPNVLYRLNAGTEPFEQIYRLA